MIQNDQPSTGRSPYAARKHDHHNSLAGGKVVPSKALDAAGEPSSGTFLRGDDTWAEIPVAPAAAPVAAGFDPNENPVIIGLGATSGTGTPDAPSAGVTGAVVIGQGATGDVDADLSVVIGPSAHAVNSQGISIGDGAYSSGYISLALGVSADSRDPGTNGSVAVGTNATAHEGAVAFGVFAQAIQALACAVGVFAQAHNTDSTALGGAAHANHDHSTAIGAGAVTAKANQIMLGTTADFVEIPGGGAANGLVLTDTATGTRYIVQITSGALVLSAAP